MSFLLFLAIWIFVFTIPFGNVIIIPAIGTITKLIGIVVIVLGFISIIEKGKLRWHLLYFTSFLFICWGWTSLLWTIDLKMTLTRITTYIGIWLAVLSIYQMTDNDIRCKNVMWAYVLGSWIPIIFIIMSYIKGIQMVRYTAPNFNPNDLSINLSFAIPLTWYLGTKTKQALIKILSWGLIPFAILSILLTGSRTGIIACGLAGIYILISITNLGWRWRLGGTVALLLVVILSIRLVPLALFMRFSTIPHAIFHGTLNKRTIIWQAGIKIFTKDPFLGIGAGAFEHAVLPIIGSEMDAHNAFLAIAVENGLIGLVLWISVIIIALKEVFALPSHKRFLYLTLIGILFVAFSTLNFEWRKVSWLIMTMAIANGRKIPAKRNRKTQVEHFNNINARIQKISFTKSTCSDIGNFFFITLLKRVSLRCREKKKRQKILFRLQFCEAIKYFIVCPNSKLSVKLNWIREWLQENSFGKKATSSYYYNE